MRRYLLAACATLTLAFVLCFQVFPASAEARKGIALGRVDEGLFRARLYRETSDWCRNGEAHLILEENKDESVYDDPEKEDQYEKDQNKAMRTLRDLVERLGCRNVHLIRMDQLEVHSGIVTYACTRAPKWDYEFGVSALDDEKKILPCTPKGDQHAEAFEDAFLSGIRQELASAKGWGLEAEANQLQFEEAARVLRSDNSDTSDETIEAQASRLLVARRFEEAIALLEPMRSLRSPSERNLEPATVRQLATAYEYVGRANDAVSLLQDSLKAAIASWEEEGSGNRDYSTFFQLGHLLERIGREDESLLLYQNGAKQCERSHASKDGAPIDLDYQARFTVAQARIFRKRAVLRVRQRSELLAEAEHLYRQALHLEFRSGAEVNRIPVPADTIRAVMEGDVPEETVGVGIVAGELASLYLFMEKLETAQRLADASLTILQRFPRGLTILSAELEATSGAALAGLGKVEAAKQRLAPALKIVDASLGSDDPVAATVRTELARVSMQMGDSNGALQFARQATASYIQRSELLNAGSSLDARAELMENRRTFDAHLASAWEVATHSQDSWSRMLEETFDIAQWAEQTAAGRALTQMASRYGAGDDALAQAVREQQEILQQRENLDKDILKLLRAPDAPEVNRKLNALKSDRDRADKRQRLLSEDLRKRFPAYAELTRPTPLRVKEAQALLRPNELLVAVYVGSDGGYVWGVRSNQAVWNRIELTDSKFDEIVRSLRSSLDPSGSRRGAVREQTAEKAGAGFDLQQAHSLYQTIFGPLKPILNGVDHILIVPAGALQSLPIAVLVAEEPSSPDYKEAAWLIRRFSTSVLPSVSSLRTLRALRQPIEARQQFLGFGDPSLGTGDDSRRGIPPIATLFATRGTSNVEAVRNLPSLPETRDELLALARIVGAQPDAVYLGDTATETNVKRLSRRGELARARVIAFATHGLVSGDLKGLAEPALVLTPPHHVSGEDDGLLTASEIARLSLNADWVILSACNTASEDQPGAESLSGLTRAFLFSGARNLLVSHWPVFSDAAVRLTTGTFVALQANRTLGRAEALRQSIIRFIDEGDDRDAAPARWAPFVLVGDGS